MTGQNAFDCILQPEGPGAPGSRPSFGRFYETAGRVKHFLAIVDTTFKTSPFLVGCWSQSTCELGKGVAECFYETAGRVKHFLAIVDTTFKTSPFLVGCWSQSICVLGKGVAECLPAGEAEAGSAGEQPAKE